MGNVCIDSFHLDLGYYSNPLTPWPYMWNQRKWCNYQKNPIRPVVPQKSPKQPSTLVVLLPRNWVPSGRWNPNKDSTGLSSLGPVGVKMEEGDVEGGDPGPKRAPPVETKMQWMGRGKGFFWRKTHFSDTFLPWKLIMLIAKPLKKMLLGRRSFWNAPVSGDMLIFGGI